MIGYSPNRPFIVPPKAIPDLHLTHQFTPRYFFLFSFSLSSFRVALLNRLSPYVCNSGAAIER